MRDNGFLINQMDKEYINLMMEAIIKVIFYKEWGMEMENLYGQIKAKWRANGNIKY